MSVNISLIISEYEKNYSLYDEAMKKLALLVHDLITTNSLHFHSIEKRVKKKVDLEKKLKKPDSNYKIINDVTDIVGLRIITYFEDDVDVAAKIIENEFQLNKDLCVDKRVSLEPDQFGYKSLHLICTLSPSRATLPEYKRYATLNFEIQIRSILQHAWAEMEHDLGYKTEQSIPKGIKRRFSRMASLLELADIEFINIRQISQEYKKEVDSKIQLEPKSIFIDKISYQTFLERNKEVQAFDLEIADLLNSTLMDPPYDTGIMFLNNVGLKTIDDLNIVFNRHKNMLIPFAKKWITNRPLQKDSTAKGISLFYLCYLVVAATGSLEHVIKFIKESNLGVYSESENLAKKVIEVFKTIQDPTNK